MDHFERVVLAGTVTLLVTLAPLFGCRDWDRYDPRLGSGASAAGGAAATGGSAAAGGGTGGSGNTGNAGGSGAATPRCGSVAVLADDYEDGTLDGKWSRFPEPSASPVSETGGQLVISAAPGDWTGYSSTFGYDMVDGAIAVEVSSATAGPTNGTVGIRAGNDSANSGYIDVTDGSIHFGYQSAGSATEVLSVPYDPQLHRHWQLRASTDTLFWETSSNGSVWTTQAQYSTQGILDPHYAQLQFEANAYGTGSAELRLDNLRGTSASGDTYCPIADLADDFGDGIIADRWAYGGPHCAVTESAGQLHLTIDGGDEESCALASRWGYDVTGASAALELCTPPPAGATLRFALVANVLTQVFMNVTGSSITVWRTDDDNWYQLHSVPFSASEQRWLRWREQDGTFFAEASPNGQDWNLLWGLQAANDSVGLQLVVTLLKEAGTLGPVQASIDNVDVLP